MTTIKKRIITSLTLLSMMAVASVAYAQEANVKVRASSTPIKARVEMKANMDARLASTTERMREVKVRMETRAASSTERKAELRAEIEVRKASSTARRVEMQQGLAKRLAEHTGKVLTATIERLEKIATRIDSRITKLKAEGGVTLEAEGFLAEARTHLSAARQGIAVFASIDLSADKAQENFEAVRNAAKEVKVDIKAAHEALKDAVKALKDARPDRENNATSTEE